MPDTEGVNNDNNVNNCAWIANGISHAKAKDMVISETHTSTHNYTHSHAHTHTHTQAALRACTIYAFAEAAEAAERMWLAARLLLCYALF